MSISYKGTLEEVITQFCEKEDWGMIKGETTASRFKNELQWLRGMVEEYAQFFGKTTDEMIAEFESKRNYSFPNYYQPANFPSLKKYKDDPHFVGVFDSQNDFQEYCKTHYVGFKCPKCGAIGKNPCQCLHRINNDGVCDWCAYGLFKGDWMVVITQFGYSVIHIFEPIKKGEIK